MHTHYRFDRLEFAGSLGDLGTLLPLTIGMILINDLSPASIFFSVGLFYILSGAYFGVTVPVQPMKIIGAYAIATGMSASQIFASGALMSVLLIVLSLMGAISFISRHIPTSVVRGVQLSTGILLMIQGVRFILGTSKFQVSYQAVEPFLSVQSLGPIPIGIAIGIMGALVTFFLIDNKKFPAGLIVVLAGLLFGVIFGKQNTDAAWQFGVFFPNLFPAGMPSLADFSFAAVVLVLPQIPTTIGNAAIAYADLSKEYFGNEADRISPKNACLSMGIANAICFALGGMPLCHGAGGLAAHYRFGARGPGSNLMIGAIFLGLACFLGPQAILVIKLIPLSIMGVLLLFAGSQLALTIIGVSLRKDMFVALTILGITLAANLAAGFIVGTTIAYCLKYHKLNV